MPVAMTAADVVSRSPDVLSGTPVFKGTRVPVQVLLDHLEAGDSIEVFLNSFPSVSREQAVAFLGIARDAALAHLDSNASASI